MYLVYMLICVTCIMVAGNNNNRINAALIAMEANQGRPELIAIISIYDTAIS